LPAEGDPVSHPLTATRRTGQVISISAGPPPRVEVQVGGDTTVTAFVPYLDSYFPTVNDYVILLGTQGDYIVVGRASTAEPRYFEERSWSGKTTTSGVTYDATDLQVTNHLVGATGWSGATWTPPVDGVYQISMAVPGLGLGNAQVTFGRVLLSTVTGGGTGAAIAGVTNNSNPGIFIQRWLFTSAALTVSLVQSSGGNKVLTNADYISIRKVPDIT
jgi:hypothetical protein